MNRTLVVSLLQKSIKELEMITEGFMEMSVYPKPIIQLSQQKIDDIQSYIKELSEISRSDEQEKCATNPHSITAEIDEQEKIKQQADKAYETDETKLIAEDALANETLADDDRLKQIESTKTVEAEKESIVDDIIVINNSDEELLSETFSLTEESSITENASEKKLIIDHSIAAVLSNKKISDIKQAINLGDRFRFQRELFNGNGEMMNKTLAKINQFENLDEALKYLKSKFDWNEEDETVEDFYQILKRRF